MAEWREDLGIEWGTIEYAGGNLLPRERVEEVSLANSGDQIGHGRQHDVGHHAFELGGIATGQVIFLNSELRGTGFGGRTIFVPRIAERAVDLSHLDDGLHGAFAVRRTISDDDGAAVVLQSAGDNLGG